MKTISLLIILISGTCFLLSSCSELSNMSVTKRHYRSGFHVDFGSSKRSVTKPQVSEAVTPVIAASASGNSKVKSTTAPEKTVQAQSPVFFHTYAEEKKQAPEKTSGNIFASTQNISAVKADAQVALLMSYVASLPDVIIYDTSRSSDSAPMWVIILFAILIPPVGVALKFGIVDKFWISLLLTLLFWLPGAIYSVIVVTQ